MFVENSKVFVVGFDDVGKRTDKDGNEVDGYTRIRFISKGDSETTTSYISQTDYTLLLEVRNICGSGKFKWGMPVVISGNTKSGNRFDLEHISSSDSSETTFSLEEDEI